MKSTPIWPPAPSRPYLSRMPTHPKRSLLKDLGTALLIGLGIGVLAAITSDTRRCDCDCGCRWCD